MEHFWHPEWDPYDALMQCQHNIQQCALAINTGSELMKQLGEKYNTQQELIKQLAFQNKKLLEITEHLKRTVNEQNIKIEMLQIEQELKGAKR